MKDKDLRYVYVTMENEGFDYCFRHYSDFKDVEDPEFHKLREAYIEAADKLEEYVNKFGEE